MREKDKITTRELNEMEISHMPDRESKEMDFISTGLEKKSGGLP